MYSYKMRLGHLVPENKEATDDGTDTGAGLEGAATGQAWDNLDINK